VGLRVAGREGLAFRRSNPQGRALSHHQRRGERSPWAHLRYTGGGGRTHNPLARSVLFVCAPPLLPFPCLCEECFSGAKLCCN